MKRLLIAFIFILLLAPACDKDKQPLIPYVYVDLTLYPNTLDYIPVGGYKLINAGYRGIVIYRILNDDFMAFERCCPYDPEKDGAQIKIDPSGTTAVDSVCMSKFILLDGSPYEGPSPYMLMQYRHSYDGEVLRIYN